MHYNHAGAIIYKAIVAVVCITECLCLLLPEASAIPTNLEPAKDGIVAKEQNGEMHRAGTAGTVPGLRGPVPVRPDDQQLHRLHLGWLRGQSAEQL